VDAEAWGPRSLASPLFVVTQPAALSGCPCLPRYAPAASLDLIEHYVYCNSTNPLSPYLNQSTLAIQQANKSISSTICETSAVSSVRQLSSDSVEAIESMEDSIACSRINPLLQHLMRDILCTDMIDGVYNLWSVQLSCALLLWLLLFFVRVEVLKLRVEDRLESEMGEFRLGITKDMYIPSGKRAKRKYLAEKKRQADEIIHAKELEVLRKQQQREAELKAWQEAKDKLAMQAEVYASKRWLVFQPSAEKASGGKAGGEDDRRAAKLVLGMAPAARPLEFTVQQDQGEEEVKEAPPEEEDPDTEEELALEDQTPEQHRASQERREGRVQEPGECKVPIAANRR